MSFSYPREKDKSLPCAIVDEVEIHDGIEKNVVTGWRPWTFSTVVLITAVFSSAGLVIVIGILQYQQFTKGSLLAVSVNDSFSTMQNFLFRYLPTIIIVLYGIGWSWIELDIRRLEPWYQLSQPGGAPADQSILLHYPVDFLPLVPIKAAKKKQWSVVCGSVIAVMVMWVITPLQNGIFNNGLLSKSSQITLNSSTGLRSVSEQNDLLDLRSLQEAYSVLWLGQRLPSFTTPDYAVVPFELGEGVSLLGSNQTIKVTTNIYGVDLTCKPPVHASVDINFDATFDDGKGCVVKGVLVTSYVGLSTNFSSTLIAYFDDTLKEGGCGPEGPAFVAVWKRTSLFPPDFGDTNNATALFCTPSYYRQEASAVIRVADTSVQSVTPTGGKQLVGGDVFNRTLFEYVLSNGAPPNFDYENSSEKSTNQRPEVTDLTILNQDTQVANMSVDIRISSIIGFAIGSTHLQPQDYLDPEKFSNALERGYKLVFALTASAMMIQPSSTQLTAQASGDFQAVSLILVFSILSQVFLLAVAACACILLYLNQHRPTLLKQDPDSLAKLMRLVNNSKLCYLFRQWDSLSERELGEVLKPYQFDLSHNAFGEAEIQCTAIRRDEYRQQAVLGQRSLSRPSSWDNAKLAKPFEYTWITSVGIITLLVGLILGLLVIRDEIRRENGLPIPSKNTIVQQIILNFIPTSLATLLEPFMVLLSRIACMMAPMERLRVGNARAQSTLLSRYTSVPPQLVFWRALRDKQFILSSLCILAILANVLTVALSGLFSVNEIFHSYPVSVRSLYQLKLKSVSSNPVDRSSLLSESGQFDAFYIADSNFSSGTLLPPWTTPHYYVLPLDIPESASAGASGTEIQAQTQGWGAGLKCSEMTLAPSSTMYELKFGLNFTLMQFLAIYEQPDGSNLFCFPYISEQEGTNNTRISGDPSGKKAFEFLWFMASLNSTLNSTAVDPCTQQMVRGWVRVANGTVPSNENSSIAMGIVPQPVGLQATFISCTPEVHTALVNLTIAPTGVIKTIEAVSPVLPFTSGDLDAVLNQTISDFGMAPTSVWHNDTIASDWPNYLLKQLMDSTDILDAEMPPPTFQQAYNASSELFGRLFTINMHLASSNMLPAAKNGPEVAAQVISPERRVFMSDNLFWIAITVLCSDLFVLTVFYFGIPAPFLPRLPTSIASQIAYFAGSHVIDDVKKAGGDLQALDKKGYRYGYGRYVGNDGWTHVGIERVPFVINLDEGRDKSWGALDRLRRRKRISTPGSKSP